MIVLTCVSRKRVWGTYLARRTVWGRAAREFEPVRPPLPPALQAGRPGSRSAGAASLTLLTLWLPAVNLP